MFLRSRTLKVFLSLFVALGLSGCAFKNMIYDRLDWVVMYQIDSYLDLNKEQKLKIKPVLAEAISWVKKAQLPSAIRLISKLETAAKERRYDQKVNELLAMEMVAFRKELLARYRAPILDLLGSLSVEQVDHLAKKMKKSNDELKDILEAKDLDDEYDEVIERQLKSVTEWYGELEDSQEEFFYKSLRLTRPEIEQKLAARVHVQGLALDVLKSHDADRLKALVDSFRDQGVVIPDPAYIKTREASESRWELYLKALHSSLTAEQWTHLENRLKETRLDLEQLSTRS